MHTQRPFVILALTVILMVLPVLSGCGATSTPTTAPTTAATQAPSAAPTKAAVQPTAVPATATPPQPTATQGPQVGGSLVFASGFEVDTLDMHKAQDSTVGYYLGAALIALAPDGNYVPWLAESWTFSADGLTWDFQLRKDVKFSDGSPLTAKDYAWTFQRILDPNTKAAIAGQVTSVVASAEAMGDYSLRLNLKKAYAPFLNTLSSAGYYQPLSKAAVEKAGDQYGRNPVGVGPYKLKEWITGTKVVLERNADYTWGPSFGHKGPWYIQTLTFMYPPEYSTKLAGLETGEIGYMELLTKDVTRIKDSGKYQVFDAVIAGFRPGLWLNHRVAAFADVKVRKAFNLALDRQTMANTVQPGAKPAFGPLASVTPGYWSGVEQIGYKYDLAQAKALLKEAGYAAGANGILEKDGAPLKFVLKVSTMTDDYVKTAQIVQDQYKALGVSIEIQQLDMGTWVADCAVNGKFEMAIAGLNVAEPDLMFQMFHSSMVGGGFNLSGVKDAALDKMLESTRTTVDLAKRQAVVNDVQKYIVENALVVPLYEGIRYMGMTGSIRGVVFSKKTGQLYLQDAWLAK